VGRRLTWGEVLASGKNRSTPLRDIPLRFEIMVTAPLSAAMLATLSGREVLTPMPSRRMTWPQNRLNMSLATPRKERG